MVLVVLGVGIRGDEVGKVGRWGGSVFGDVARWSESMG